MIKRNVFIFFVFFIFAGLIFPQSITVTDPAQDEVVYKGSAYTVKWSKTGTMIDTVKIRLFNSTGIKIKNIINSTGNDGTYKTIETIFDNVAPGNYMIRVKTTDDAVWDNSSVFKLRDPTSSTPPISTTLQKTITKPSSTYPGIAKASSSVMVAIPYIKSVDFESEPRVLFTGPPASPRGRLFYYQIISAKIGNKGLRVTRDTDIVLTAKRTTRPAIDAPFKIPTSKNSVSISPGATKEFKLAYYTKTPGVFDNTLDINVNDKTIESKTLNSESTGVAELYLKVETKVKTRIGEDAELKITIVNMGDLRTPYYRIGIFDYKTKITTLQVPKLYAKKSHTITTKFLWKKAIANIWVVLDCKKQINEASRKNNYVKITMTEYTDQSPNPIKTFLGNKKDYDGKPGELYCN